MDMERNYIIVTVCIVSSWPETVTVAVDIWEKVLKDVMSVAHDSAKQVGRRRSPRQVD